MSERNYKPVLTIILVLINVAVFFMLTSTSTVLRYAFVPAYAASEPWRMITAMFLHADMNHLFLNMLALFMFGMALETRIGSGRFMLLYLLAGTIANVGYMVTASDPTVPAIGASGAVYGIMGASAIIMPFAIVIIGVPVPMIVAAFIWGATEFSGLFVQSNIARGAHLLGLAFGMVYGIHLRRVVKRRRGQD